MRAQLKSKILLWKNNALAGTKRRRLLEASLRRSQQRERKLSAEVNRLKKQLEPIRVRNHSYPAQLIALAVFIVVHGNGSLRCAAKTIGFVAQLLGWDYGVPSHTSVRRWVLGCGLYGLDYAKEKSGDYVGIIDESIQIGREKMLLLLGVKLSEQQSHAAALSMSDVEVLGVEVQQSWKSDQVAEFIRDRVKLHPKINLQYMISDRGSNLLAAMRNLSLNRVSDCTHHMMNAIKKIFAEQKALSNLCRQIGQLRQQYILTELGFLLPPSFRTKDRFLQMFSIIDWADRIDSYWPKLKGEQRRALRFLRQEKTLLRKLRQVRALTVIAANILKGAGISSVSQQLWEKQLAQYRKGKRLTLEARTFIKSIEVYFEQHQDLLLQHQRLLCCSDIIETTFGHYKNKGGTKVISADVLALTLYNQQITPAFVKTALQTVQGQKVEEWQQRYTCDNRYSFIRRMDKELKCVA